MDKRFFIIENKHVESCGVPPIITNANSNNYFSYFENEHGEQWVFEYDYSTKTGKLHGGDVGWDDVYSVFDGQVDNLILNTNEKIWLRACWFAATDS